MFLVACSGTDRPTAPTALSRPPVVVPPPPPVEQPPFSGARPVHEFSGPLAYSVSDYTTTSEYVVYDSGAFILQYLGFEYRGKYEGDAAELRFYFTDDSQWSATGTLNGELLEIRYSFIAQLDGFDNAVYKRVR